LRSSVRRQPLSGVYMFPFPSLAFGVGHIAFAA
jgi:hypothetical protein